MLRRLYDWTMDLAAHRHALLALGCISFIESSLFPVPPDILLIPMVLAVRERAFLIATVCTIASVLGGLFGYGIGFFLYETIGRAIVEFYGYQGAFRGFKADFAEWGWWIVIGGGFTPFPYKIITIMSGFAALDPFVFTAASAASRGVRFFLETGLLWYFGEPIRVFIETHLGNLAALFFILLLGGFVVASAIF